MSNVDLSAPHRILVIETLYLGDLIHTLPLIHAVRMRYPAAQLHVLARAAFAPLLAGHPDIDQVLVMDPRLHKSWGGLRALADQLKAGRYDWVVNPGASDRASVLTWMSGAHRRIGRLNRKGSRLIWRCLHDEVLCYPYDAEPMWWQKQQAFSARLALPGGQDGAPAFGLESMATSAAPPSVPKPYIHISPCASEDIRSLPPATVVNLLQALRRAFPQHALVLSAGPSERERTRLRLIAGALGDLPVHLFAGNLNLPALAGLIQRAALHIGPDSGPLHLAHALKTPVVGCFLYKDGSSEWLPLGATCRTVGVGHKWRGGLYGLDLKAVVEAAGELLAKP